MHRTVIRFVYQQIFIIRVTRFEVREISSAEQCCFTQSLASWTSYQDPSKISQDSWIFLRGIPPESCKIVKKKIQKIQDSYHEIQESRNPTGKSKDKIPDIVRIFHDFTIFFRIFEDQSRSSECFIKLSPQKPISLGTCIIHPILHDLVENLRKCIDTNRIRSEIISKKKKLCFCRPDAFQHFSALIQKTCKILFSALS